MKFIKSGTTFLAITALHLACGKSDDKKPEDTKKTEETAKKQDTGAEAVAKAPVKETVKVTSFLEKKDAEAKITELAPEITKLEEDLFKEIDETKKVTLKAKIEDLTSKTKALQDAVKAWDDRKVETEEEKKVEIANVRQLIAKIKDIEDQEKANADFMSSEVTQNRTDEKAKYNFELNDSNEKIITFNAKETNG